MHKKLRNSPRGRAGAIVGPAVLFAVIGCDDTAGTTGGGGSTTGGSGGSGGLEADAGAGGHVHGGSGGEGGHGGQHMGGQHMGGQHMGGQHMGGSGGHGGGSGGHGGGAGGHAGGAGGHAGGAGGHAGGAGGHAGGHGGGHGGEGGVQLIDMGQPPPPADAGLPPDPDAAPPPMMCLDLVGQACETSNEGCCDAQGNGQVWCQLDAAGNMTYQAIPPDFFCNCYVDEATGKTMVACAVPGFVGIDRAHRPRRMGRRIRIAVGA